MDVGAMTRSGARVARFPAHGRTFGAGRTERAAFVGLRLCAVSLAYSGRTTSMQFEPLQRRIRRTLEEGGAQKNYNCTAHTCANLLKGVVSNRKKV